MRDMAKIVTVASKGKMFEKDKICYVSFEETAYECIVPISVNIGDKMVFIEADSILPEEEKWEFLRKRCYREDLHGFLIKCMTMGKKANEDGTDSGNRVKSWGLCVTLAEAGIVNDLQAGTDVTELLNIIKYEPVEDASPTKQSVMPKFIRFCLNHKITRWIGNAWLKKKRRTNKQSSFPSEIISKSDETTIQNCKSILKDFPGKRAFITAKLEGQSFTVSLDKKTKKLYVCSRNNRYNEECDAAKLFFEAAKKYDIERKLKEYYKKTSDILVIQGEQVGPGIQGNIYNLSDVKWFVFRVKAITKHGEIFEYNYQNFLPIIFDLGLSAVPLLDVVEDMGVQFPTVDSLVSYAETASWSPKATGLLIYHPSAKDKLWKTYMQHEGIVVKSDDYNKEKGTGFSFKVKNMAYQEKSYTEMNALAKSMQS